MSEYSSPINTELYKYIQPVYVTEPTGESQTFIPLKLNLNSNNFNFDLARSDGLDFHLAEKSNGSGVLQMWIAYWDVTAGKATVWFKLPELLASETRILFAIWGYEHDSGISNLEDLVSGYTNIYSDNLCRGGTVTGEGIETITGFPTPTNNPGLVFDGDPDTYWRLSPGAGTWIQYDFGAANEKQIQLIKMLQYKGKDVVFRGSNDGIVFTDLFSRQLPDLPGGTDPSEWSSSAFDNKIAYRYIRVDILTDWGSTFHLKEIEMMEVASRTVAADGVFYFGDDFDGSSLDVSKWPTTNGSWTMDNSSIRLATDAWINSDNVLGDASTFYTGPTSKVTIADGLWGNHQTTGNCYLSYQGYLSYNQSELIDGDYTSYNQYSWIASNAGGAYGCGIGVDLGAVIEKINRIRVYVYDHTEANLSDLEWPSTSYIVLYKSNTNAIGDQKHIYTYTYTEIPLVKFANNVWYFDLDFLPPGETTRYFHILGYESLTHSAYDYIYSEVEVYTRNTSSNFLASNFIVEEGVIGIGNPSSTTVAAHRYRFYGGENVLGIDYFWEGSTDRKLDVTTAGSYVAYPGTNKGLIIGEYNQSYLGYYEATDRVYQGMSNRGADSTPVYSDNLCTAGDLYAVASRDIGPPYGPEAAFDDNENTYWVGLDGVDVINWAGYEFVSPQKITRVVILWGNVYSYNIEGSNGSESSWDNKSWTILSSGSGYLSGTWTEDIFDNPIQYRYVRVNITAFSGNAPYIYEIKMFRADSFSSAFDYDDSWERGVHRNTQLASFRIYGEDSGSANGVAVDWVIARPFEPNSDPVVDATALWINYEYVRHQQLDYSEYTGDVTNVNFHHSSDMAGDPYKMSDNITNNLLNIFVSDAEITEGNITIDFGRYKDSVTSVNYIHFNSDSVYFYNASKLSDFDTDVHGRNYWQSTTTPGWAAIQFPDTKNISCLYLRAVPGNTGKMVKDFKFYGSQSDPRFSGWDDKVLIYEDSAREIEEEQAFYFSTGLTFYKYYILEAIMSFDDYEIEKINTQYMIHDTSWGGIWAGNNAPENVSDGNGSSYMQSGLYPPPRWVSIDLGVSVGIYKVILKGLFAASDRLVKNFRVEASINNLDWYVIYTGITVQNSNPQEFIFNTPSTEYRYWRLVMLDTWGDTLVNITRFELFRFAHDGVAIQEWGMYEHDSRLGKKTISQLRLHPVAFEENEYYFTKQIELHGSNDGFVWDTLISTTNTPTPFTDYAYGRWSRYSFKNFEGYYQYKLKCYDNWRSATDIIKMAEWEMVESTEEFNNFRILAGSSNNINNIWADPTTTINSGTLYITNEDFNTVEYDKLIHQFDLASPEAGRPGHWVDVGNVISDLTYDGIATANLATYQDKISQWGPQNAFDNSLSTYWHSVVYYSYPIWLQYQFTGNRRIFEVRMRCRQDGNYTGRMPGDFIIKGSNTGGFTGEETDIVIITGATYRQDLWTTFNFVNPDSFLYYRFHITDKASGTGAGNYMNIAEIEMEGYVQEYIPEIEGAGGVDDFNVKL